MRRIVTVLLLIVVAVVGLYLVPEKHTFEIKDGKFLYDGKKV